MSNYVHIREKLLERRAELTDRLERITSNVRHDKEPLSADFAEQATERENEEVMDALGNKARDELKKISAALMRMDEDEYGDCLECGRPINVRRLEAQPFADLCIECANMAEAAG